MHANEYAILVNLGFLGAVLLMVLPALIYLRTGWKIRRDKLFSYLNEEALHVYYQQFPWKPGLAKNGDQKNQFRLQFQYLYGRRHFLLPFLLLILISSLAAWGMALSVRVWFRVAQSSHALPKIAVSALLGAFVWAIFDELGRIQRRDVSPSDVYSWNFRFLAAIPFGFAFAAVIKDDFGVPLAFFLGAFPTQTLFTFARRIVVQRLGLGEQTGGALELEKLQSIGRSNAERFEDEGINTISTLAWADPIDLTIRTNFDFNYVLDCMSQALLWVYLEDKCKLLYALSVRGAQEVNVLVNDLGDITLPVPAGAMLTPKQKIAVATLQSAAQAVGVSIEAMYSTLGQVSRDPYTQFIVKVWH